MYQVYCLNKISELGLKEFPQEYIQKDQIDGADAILVRSAAMHEMQFQKELKVIARAGAGVNNIPLEACAEQGIVVLNTPGANANGVKELVIAGLLLASRDVVGGIDWVREHKEESDVDQQAEKAKKAFAGCEIQGKKLGVIGLGAIGGLVANTALHLGMEVYGYDPYVSVDAAWQLSRRIYHAKTVDEIYQECDYITLHVPAIPETIGMISKETIQMMKNGVVILNFARGTLVKDEDLIEALEEGKVKKYVTDFPNFRVANAKNVIVIPHLGASTEESEDNCARMAVRQVVEYLKNGNIKNSVNYPNCDMGAKGNNTRITILHRNIPNMIGQFTAVLAEAGVNISNMTNQSRNGYAYTMLDVEGRICENITQKLNNINEVLKVRVIE